MACQSKGEIVFKNKQTKRTNCVDTQKGNPEIAPPHSEWNLDNGAYKSKMKYLLYILFIILIYLAIHTA